MGEAQRERIVVKLSFKTWTNTKQVSTQLGMENALAFHHLKVLRQQGIVESRLVELENVKTLSRTRVTEWRLISLDEAGAPYLGANDV